MKILCLGHAAYDITFPLDEFPIENTKNRVKERVECGGGPASTAAYLLGKWGMDVYFAGLVGNDLYGKRIKKELDNIGVDTTYLQMSNNFETTTSFIIANKKIGSRTILTYRNDDIEMDNFNLDFKPDVILIDGQEYTMSKKILKKYPNAISIIDAGRPKEKIIELSHLVNYLVCSKEFAETVTNMRIDYNDINTLITIHQKMEEIFKNNVVITLESKGALFKNNNEIKLMPSIPVKSIDSTGAGDIFHGAFTYGIANGFDYENVIQMSNIAGALSVTKIGGRNSVASIEEMEEYFDDFR